MAPLDVHASSYRTSPPLELRSHGESSPILVETLTWCLGKGPSGSGDDVDGTVDGTITLTVRDRSLSSTQETHRPTVRVCQSFGTLSMSMSVPCSCSCPCSSPAFLVAQDLDLVLRTCCFFKVTSDGDGFLKGGCPRHQQGFDSLHNTNEHGPSHTPPARERPGYVLPQRNLFSEVG